MVPDVVVLALPAATIAEVRPRSARSAGTAEAMHAVRIATTALNAWTRQSIDTGASVLAIVGLIASSAVTADRASSKPGISPQAQTISSSARCTRTRSAFDAPSARRSDNSPARATACADAGRSFTRTEWERYVTHEKFQEVCR